jgi:hypothetical protein
MLTAESQGAYAGWQNLNGSSATASNQLIKSPTSAGQLQGTINLVQAFGSMPATLYLCAAAYTTTNGGSLVAQAPAGNGNGNIESNEFLALPVAAIIDSASNGIYDFLDPQRLFRITGAILPMPGFVISWLAVPGKGYQVLYCDVLGTAWLSNGIPAATAASGQTNMTYIDTTVAGTTQRFYKVKSPP